MINNPHLDQQFTKLLRLKNKIVERQYDIIVNQLYTERFKQYAIYITTITILAIVV